MPPTRREFDLETISDLTVARLSIYLRCLRQLEARGVETVSSRELADEFHLNSGQIRKDLAYFGEFGIRGVGYRVGELKQHLIEILGLDRERRLVIVGAGNLGMALCHHKGFTGSTFLVVGVLDNDPEKVGHPTPAGLLVEDVSRLPTIVERRDVEIGVITTPPESAQQTCDVMAEAGLRTILNFAPTRLRTPAGTKTVSVDLKVHLEELSFFLSHGRHLPEGGAV